MQNRRQFLTRTGALAGMMLASESKALAAATEAGNSRTGSFDLMKEVFRYRKIDAHAHIYFSNYTADVIVDTADRLGIEKLVISRPMAPGSGGDPKEFVSCNNLILDAMQKYPDRFFGQMTFNPQFPKESKEEIRRCLDKGMIGVKLYNHVKINDPLFYPFIETFIEKKMLILMHMGIGKARITYDAREPVNVSIPSDMVDIARKYPEGRFQLAHIGGGIDWEDACKAIQDTPNIYVDVSGSNNAAHMIDFAVKTVGIDRLFFGCDNSYFQGVGHVLAAGLTEADRRKLFFENYNQYLKSIGRHVD